MRRGRDIQYEERGLAGASSKRRPGDVTTADPGCPLQVKLVMDGTTASCLKSSTLDLSSISPDEVMHKAEMKKFSDDRAAARPIQEDPAMRLIPLAANQFGRRGWHFEALLIELAYYLVDRPSGCHLLEGTFAMSAYSAAFHIKRRWGAKVTCLGP